MKSIYQYRDRHPRETPPVLEFAKIQGSWSADKVGTAQRLISAYRSSITQSENELKCITDADLWSGIVKGHFSRMLDLVASDSAEELSHFLTDFGSQYLWFGGVSTWIDGYNHWDTSDLAVAASYFDVLVSLGEALGVLPAENPEQGAEGNWGRNVQRDPTEVADLISDRLGIDITPPTGIIAAAGLPFRGGVLHYRHLNALYSAWRTRDLSAPGDSICEYGGGLGLVPFYLSRFGRNDVTLYDLPIANMLSGFFLIGALGHDAVCLEGEPQRTSAIKIRANWNCVDAPDRAFHLTLNQDSFPEINARILSRYLEQIQRTTTGYILSINHEAEHRIEEDVRHLNISQILSTQSWLRRFYRSPYWLRAGYVEELYRIVAWNRRGS